MNARLRHVETDDTDTLASLADEMRAFAASYERHGAGLAAQPLRDWAERLDAIRMGDTQ